MVRLLRTSSPIPQDVHQGLASRAHWIKNYVPYNRSSTGLRREVDVLKRKVELLKEEAVRLGWQGQGEGQGENKEPPEPQADAMET